MTDNMWDDEAERPAEPDDIELRVLQVGAAPGDIEGTYNVTLRTTRGDINGILHPVEGGTGAIVCVGGAMGGLDGPADALYARLPGLLAEKMVTVLRLTYREPNNLEECVADVLAGCSFLKGIGGVEIGLVGHSFGGAVVIKAGELWPAVRAVVSMSPQLHGTRQVHQLGKPLLLVHGTADTILDHAASEDIYRRAEDPKRIVLYADTGHSLIQAKEQVGKLLAEWLPARLAGETMESGRSEYVT
ncbi:MAG: alpha/beta hydrolase [Dehalococcoidia bacterium]